MSKNLNNYQITRQKLDSQKKPRQQDKKITLTKTKNRQPEKMYTTRQQTHIYIKTKTKQKKPRTNKHTKAKKQKIKQTNTDDQIKNRQIRKLEEKNRQIGQTRLKQDNSDLETWKTIKFCIVSSFAFSVLLVLFLSP